jgi:hypothetical protein
MTVIPPSAQATRLSFKVSEGTAFDWCSTIRVHFSSVNGRFNRTAPARNNSAAGVLCSDN